MHNAAVDGDAEKSERAFKSQLLWRRCRRLAQNIFLEVAHDDHKANHHSENRLEKFVANVNQEACADKSAEECGERELQENLLVQVAVAHQVDGAAEVPDDKPDAVRTVCYCSGESHKYHDGEAQGRAAARDAVDKAYHCA